MLGDKKLSICITWMIIGLFLVNSMNILSSYIGISAATMSIINKLVLFVLLLRALPIVFRRFNKNHLFTITITIVLFLLNYMLFPYNYTVFKNTAITFVTTILPILLVVIALKDYEVTYKYLKIGSFVTVILSIIVLVLSFFHKNVDSTYSMGYSNSLIFPLIIVYYEINEKVRWYKIAMFVAGMLSLMVLGSRGSIIAIVSYIVVLLLKNISIRTISKKQIFFLATIIALAISYHSLLNVLINMLGNIGINSRTLKLLVSTDTIYLSGRDDIYNIVWNAIKKAPFAIRGINADYGFAGVYSHNIVLELFCEFGVLLGFIIIVWIIYSAIKTLCLKQTSFLNHFTIMLMCASLPKLFISGTLWTQVYFWIWICVLQKALFRKNCALQKRKVVRRSESRILS